MPVIADSWALYNITLLMHVLLYFGGPVLLFRSGWPVAGGVVMLASTILPLAAQTWFTDSDVPGFAFLLMVEVPLALLALIAGCILSIVRLVIQRRRMKAESEH